MDDTAKESGKKKGFWAAIKESMTKTGGCCGSGGNCCGSTKKEPEKKRTEKEPAAKQSRCGN